MYIRFISGEIDPDSRLSAGLFCAAHDLRWSDGLPDYELDLLCELRDWFELHLQTPFDYLPREPRYDSAVCWFKSTANEHLARAWELVEILERNDILIWTIKAQRVGYIHYEDCFQVFARPYDEVLRLFR